LKRQWRIHTKKKKNSKVHTSRLTNKDGKVGDQKGPSKRGYRAGGVVDAEARGFQNYRTATNYSHDKWRRRKDANGGGTGGKTETKGFA